MRPPGFDEVVQLPQALQREVPPEYLDANDHMNVQYYLVLGSLGLELRFGQLGLGVHNIPELGQTQFVAEHHLRYHAELRAGTPISVHTRLLDRSDRALHAMAFLLDRTNNRLAFTMELVAVQVDVATRRATAFPPRVEESIDRALAEDAALGWPAPVSGVMGIRRSD